jgi:hypothetical protein
MGMGYEMWLIPIFLRFMSIRSKCKLNIRPVKTLDEAKECYGEENLIPITFIKQVIFYAKLGVQPVLCWAKEDDDNRIAYWYLKSETQFAKRKWDETKPKDK